MHQTDLVRLGEDLIDRHDGTAMSALPVALVDAVRGRFGLVSHSPFFLADDGTYDIGVARFFRFLTTDGASAKLTLGTYGRHLSYWIKWLAEQGMDWKEAGVEDLRRYYRLRRIDNQCSANYWNLSSASIARLYKFAYDDGLIPQNPFPQKIRRVWKGDVYQKKVAVNGLKDKPENVITRFMTIDEYKTFRASISRTSAGRERRTTTRNKALLDLLIRTGMRITEALSMEVWELPDPDASQWNGWSSCTMRLRAETTKGSRSRIIAVPKATLREIRRYIEEDRMVSVARRTGRSKSLYVEPPEIWLTEHGDPLDRYAVTRFFDRISRETGIKCTPHCLRHSFATYMLSRLIKVLAHQIEVGKNAKDRDIYRDIVEDPLRKLQRLLGHRQITTTYKYLDIIQLRDPSLDAAICAWDEDFWEADELLVSAERGS